MNGVWGAVFLAAVLGGASIALAQGTAPAAPPVQKDSQGAPAAQQIPEWLKYKPSYGTGESGEQNDIANPHRTTDEISAWAQQASADVLSFSAENQDAKISSFKKYFTAQGWQLYISYLKDAKILEMVDQAGYSVSTIVSQPPEVVNRGAAGGVYHWIVRMPITISFFKKDPASEEPKAGPSGKFYLFLDIARTTQESDAEDSMGIVNWRVMDVPKN